MNRSLCFSHNNRQFRVKAFQENDGWRIRVYENDRPVTAITYRVAYETDQDAQMQGISVDLVDHMMDVAKSDIEEGIVKLLS